MTHGSPTATPWGAWFVLCLIGVVYATMIGAWLVGDPTQIDAWILDHL